jgi:hypothetical protein
MTAWSTHPVPVARAAELRQWVDSGEYARILAGAYPRRDGDGNASVSEDIKAAAASYRESFNSSQDPLVGLLRRLGDGAADVGGWAGSAAGRARNWVNTAGEAAAQAARRGRSDGDGGNGTDGTTPPA